MTVYLKTLIATTMLLCSMQGVAAHSGKARFHAIVDTDCAADDLRTLCMLLSNREVEILAVTTSDGAIAPSGGAMRVSALLRRFHHEGIPVGAGRTVTQAPPWRLHSEQIDWGTESGLWPTAEELIIETIENEEEPVVFVALGALTNIGGVLHKRPELSDSIERIVWFDNSTPDDMGANFKADTIAAQRAMQSGVKVEIVACNSDFPITVNDRFIGNVAAVGTPYAEKIASTHRTSPLDSLIAEGHLQLWDDLTAAYLFAPELFAVTEGTGGIRYCSLHDSIASTQVEEVLLTILRGKPDAESRVFNGFPTDAALYAADVAPMIAAVSGRHGASEWRAAVLTNELHGHLGIYATVGVKMGIRAREYFNIGVDDIEVVSMAGSNPPVSCLNDGLQVATGATIGHGLISVVSPVPPRPEATFSFKGKTIRLRLKPEYAERIAADVKQAVADYGNLTEPYWLRVRELALQYWAEFDRHEIFILEELG